MPTKDDDSSFPFPLPNTGGGKVTAAFDGGLISSNGGVLLLAGVDKRLGLIDALAALIPDHRDPARITHAVAGMRTAMIWMISGETRLSNWPVGVCRKAGAIWPRNRRSRVWRTPPSHAP